MLFQWSAAVVNFCADASRPNSYEYCTISSPGGAEPNTPTKSTDPFVKFVDEVCAQTVLKIPIPTPSIRQGISLEEQETRSIQDLKMIAQIVEEEGPYNQANASRFKVLVCEIKKAVPEMDAEELVNTIISMAGHYNIRDMDTLNLICRQLCSSRSLNVNQLAGLANALADLTVLDLEVISKIKSEFVEHLIHPMEWDQFTLIAASLARLQVGDVKLWEQHLNGWNNIWKQHALLVCKDA
uniref:MIF4G domain-containing protein n=1 Tax=Ditylenchus dipsaci TaxID=166011 RepID=A0A915CZZ6_9BILA